MKKFDEFRCQQEEDRSNPGKSPRAVAQIVKGTELSGLSATAGEERERKHTSRYSEE